MSGSPPEQSLGLLLSVQEAARLLGQPARKVYGWLAEGRLPGTRRFGRALYISRPALEAWLAGDGAKPPTPGEVQGVGPTG